MAEKSHASTGRILSGWLSAIASLAIAAGLMGLAAPVIAGPVCGPGAHWVDSCPAGTDVLPFTEGEHTIDIFGIGQFTLKMNGPTTVWRGAGRITPDHQIDTEIVSLQLVGGGMTLNAGDGAGNGLCDGSLCSLGRIGEQAGDPTLADSFFDVFFEIQGTPFGTLHNQDACRMTAVLDQVPPKALTTYICDTTTIPIFLFQVAGTNPVGQLLGATHTILVPEPASLALVGIGLVGVIAVGGNRRRRCAARAQSRRVARGRVRPVGGANVPQAIYCI